MMDYIERKTKNNRTEIIREDMVARTRKSRAKATRKSGDKSVVEPDRDDSRTGEGDRDQSDKKSDCDGQTLPVGE